MVGMGPGIGLAVAKRFGREGFRVAALARSSANLEGCRKELAAQGMETHAFVTDAGDPASLAATFAEVRAALGDPSVLVYNAAVLHMATASALDPAQLANDFQVNVTGALASAQQVLPAMRAAQRGTLLFTGGGLALDPFPQFASLAIGKAGIRSLAFSLAKELEADGIHAATVTVCGMVKPGTRYDPDLIAEEYWKLHTQPAGSWEREMVFR
ncbi:putative Short-chain dehydrogenase/reductase family protein [Chondromyces apiculatus DSM 436]|uniref:Putative Short-chain dehydrogenase/reductase family protein n=1 Tax=Chondromyces apiculatus DSM 436 TaxID=1192034 RepID=A0A017T1N7_9BACT|nr:putative Short-chain dehydrogenase/reductase family protein [Chondromyces apiculatus DSM 436]